MTTTDAVISALAAVASEDPTPFPEPAWTEQDVRARASRVTLGRCVPLIGELPDSVRDWLEVLPAVSTVERVATTRPSRPVDWAATARRNHGWPPSAASREPLFVGRRRQRVRDTLLASCLRWTAAELADVRRAAATVSEGVERDVLVQLSAIDEAAGVVPGPAIEPRDDELDAVERAGNPWRSTAALARELQRLRHDVVAFAFEVVLPDDALRWRLFHLGVYGELLALLRAHDARVRSLGPLTGGAVRPTHGTDDDEGRIEVWFEASGCWRWYARERADGNGLYTRATRAIRGRRGTLAPDCLVVLLDSEGVPLRAVSLECKYSLDPTYVGRQGYLQALAYGTELAFALRCDVSSFVVAPDAVVAGSSSARRRVALEGSSNDPVVVEVGVTGPSDLGSALVGLGLESSGSPHQGDLFATR